MLSPLRAHREVDDIDAEYDEPQPEGELDDEDVDANRRARASIRAGRKVPMDLLSKLLPES